MSDGLPYIGDPLTLLLQQAGLSPGMSAINNGQAMPPARHFLSLGRRPAMPRPVKPAGQVFAPQGIDQTNPYDQQGASAPAGTMVDPRYAAQAAAVARQLLGPGIGDAPDPNMAPLPAYAPRVGVEQQAAHPMLTNLAYALQQALASQQPTGRTRNVDGFLHGLLSGASGSIVNADQQRQALNTQNRTAAANMNLMNSALSAQQAKAAAPTAAAQTRMVPLSASILEDAKKLKIDTTPWEQMAAKDANGMIPQTAMANLQWVMTNRKGPGARSLTPDQLSQAASFGKGIVSGRFPPSLVNGRMASTPFGGAVMAWINDNAPNFDLANAQLKFTADNSNIRTQNAAQSLRYRQAVDSSNRYTAVLDYLNDLRARAGGGNAPVPMNEFNQRLARLGLPSMNTPTDIATALRQYTGALRTEYGFVLSAGYAATAEDKKTANDTIDDAWGTDQFSGGLDAVRGILQIRQNSIPAGGAYTPGGTINLGGASGTPIPQRASGTPQPKPLKAGYVRVIRNGILGQVPAKEVLPTDQRVP